MKEGLPKRKHEAEILSGFKLRCMGIVQQSNETWLLKKVVVPDET
jgi:hypothetical protein